MLDMITAEYYYRALVQELDREADRIYRAHQAQTEEKSHDSYVLPFIPRPHCPFSGLHTRSVYR
jgi:hypothetical protein